MKTRRVLSIPTCLALLAATSIPSSAAAASPTPALPAVNVRAQSSTDPLAPPFTQCPPTGQATGCNVLIVATDTDRHAIFQYDTSQSDPDGASGDHLLVGVQNNASQTLMAVPIQAATPVFAFENNDPAPYAGPGVTFSNISADKKSGLVNFSGGLAPGASSFFMLNGNLHTTATPFPAAPDIQVLPQPQRLDDTRLDGGRIPTNGTRCFTVAGVDGVPTDTAGVLLNVTAVGQTSDGWLTVYPAGQPVPSTSTLNFGTDEFAMANGAMVRVGSNHQVCVNVGTVNNVAGGANVVLDITGYLTSTSTSDMPMLSAPVRLADTRINGGAVSAGTTRCFAVAGVDGIPSTAAAAILNVTAVGYKMQGWLTVYPGGGQSVPATSTVNFDTHEYAMANNTIAAIGSDGKVCVNVGSVGSVAGSSQVVLDAVGYLAPGGLSNTQMLSSPIRLADTRSGSGAVARAFASCFMVAGVNGVPPTAVGVIVNVTGVGYTRPGWLTAYPSGQGLPATSTLNFDISEYAIANGAILPLGGDGKLCVGVGTVNNASGASQVVVDVMGYLLP